MAKLDCRLILLIKQNSTEEVPERFSRYEITYNYHFKIVGTYDYNMIDFIDGIVNPIDDDKVIRKLLGCFENGYKGFGGFYGRMTQCTKKEYHKGEHYACDKDAFESALFNRWKKSILEMSKDEFISLYQKGKLREDFVTVRNYLKTIDDVETAQQVREMKFLISDNTSLMNSLNNYSWTAPGEGSGWVHVSSKYVRARRENSFDTDARLYLNAEPFVSYPLALEFIKKRENGDYVSRTTWIQLLEIVKNGKNKSI